MQTQAMFNHADYYKRRVQEKRAELTAHDAETSRLTQVATATRTYDARMFDARDGHRRTLSCELEALVDLLLEVLP